jgi:hypothetical protein
MFQSHGQLLSLHAEIGTNVVKLMATVRDPFMLQHK